MEIVRQFHPRRYRAGNLGTWSGHLPFANDLIWELRPKTLVELGTHYGESYFGFCQAVEESGADTRCFAVDTWRGDEHAGFYGEDVYREVQQFNGEHYGSFSTLIRSTFDEARGLFEPESIDLLHIDGLHTYEAVKHDFEVWFAKVRPGGIVLLHDTNVRHADFEVWRLWGELAREYSHFEFRHCWGLGVLKKPGGAPDCDFLNRLFRADKEMAERIRTQYSDAAELLESRERGPEKTQAAAEADRPYLQVFPGLRDMGFEEKTSVLSNIEEGVWKRHSLTLTRGADNGLIRVDIVNRPGLVEISEITVRTPVGEAIEIQLSSIRCEGHSMRISEGDAARFFSWGNDPQLIVELPDSAAKGEPLQFEITMRVVFDFAPLSKLLAQRDELEREVALLRIAALKEDHARARSQWSLAAAETQVAHLQKENTRLRSDAVGAIEQFVEGAVQAGRMAGAVLLIARRGRLASHRALGWLDKEAGIPMPLNALFYVLSMTKAVTCAVFLTLVEEGKASVDDPVERWLPEFKNIAFADGRKPEQAPRLWQCMAHSSGLLDSFPASFLKSRFTLPEFVSVGARNQLGYEPGCGWAYCNLGIAVIGRVIELASGRPYLEMVQERILNQIQMTDSFFRVPTEQLARIATIYLIAGDTLLRDNVKPFANLADYSAPENGLMTTAFDFWRFHEMIRNGGVVDGRRVLSETSARSLTAVHTGDRNAGFLPGMGYGYGLSLVTEPTGAFRNHSAGTFGHGSQYQAHAWTDPVKGITGILFSHNRSESEFITAEIEQILPMLGALD